MNIYDIASKAGVSITTVSRVINGSSNVSLKTKEKVQQVMKEMNYIPSQLAVGLATRTTKTIGILLPDVRDSFHAEVAYRIESKMSLEGYMCILCNTNLTNGREVDYLHELYKKNVDGIILVGSTYQNNTMDEGLKRWENKIPIVLINAVSQEGTASVVCDVEEGIKQALIHLQERGKQHPVFIKDTSEYQKRASITKEDAFIKSYREIYGDKNLPEQYRSLPYLKDYLAVIEELKNKEADSILFTSDMCCAVFLKAMQCAGLETPGDYALIGFNNASITSLTTPAITTIDHLVNEHCEAAIDKLLKLMKNETVEKITYIKPQLVVRETT